MSNADSILKLDGLGKDFGSKPAVEALSCEVRGGEIVGLLGPNGAGKTTTMKLVMGVLRPSRGAASVLGLDCMRDAREVKRRIGFSPDEPAFYDFLTGRETIDFVLNVRGEDRDAAWKRVQPLVDDLAFAGELDVAAGGYSHGTKKKLALLVALAHAPALLLLDEPTNGLDPPTAARVRTLLREEAKRGAAVVVSTHLLEMADLICDRVLVLDHGRLVAEGTTAEVRAHAGVAAEASLEDAFLALVKR
ncbi:MAG TPA: ABC transporter ATP-binding protein [Labilithrix sp.]